MARSKDTKLKRKHQINFLFNEMEKKAFDKYCKRYNVDNRSKFMREVIVSAILQHFDKDHPSLFENNEPESTEQESTKIKKKDEVKTKQEYQQGVLAF